MPTDIPLGTNVIFKDSVAYSVPMSNWLLDYSPWNNVDYFTTTTVASFDPNFKEVNPKGTGPEGLITTNDSVLEYMVHFQNTGTSFAQNIVVIDTLDANLDWSTLHPIFQSYPCNITVSDAGVARFTFTNIDLPAETTDDLRSNGMFTYSIQTRHGLPYGTQFRNGAAIYFDYNAPVYTNTTLNTLAWPDNAQVKQPADRANSFMVYPNPAKNSFSAVIADAEAGAYELRVTDISGRSMINKAIYLQKGRQSIPVDASALSPGMYFVTVSNEGKTQTQKLAIMK